MNAIILIGMTIKLKAFNLLSFMEIIPIILALLYLSNLIPNTDRKTGLYYVAIQAGMLAFQLIIYWAICIYTLSQFQFKTFFIMLLLYILNGASAFLVTWNTEITCMSSNEFKEFQPYGSDEDLYEDDL